MAKTLNGCCAFNLVFFPYKAQILCKINLSKLNILQGFTAVDLVLCAVKILNFDKACITAGTQIRACSYDNRFLVFVTFK